MIIIGLIAAFCLYVILYWIYQAAATNSNAVSILATINKALWMPEPEIFVLLRGLIIITFFYVVADAIVSPTRRGLKNNRRKKLDAERDKVTFRGTRPRSAPTEDEDEEEDDTSTFAPPRFSA